MGNCFLYKRGGGSGGSVPEIIKATLGRIILLTDSKNAKLKGLRVFGKTIQDGTPTPDAPVPLESAGDSGTVNVMAIGKNLIDMEHVAVTRGYFISASGVITADSSMCYTDVIPIPPGIYTLSQYGNVPTTNNRIHIYDKNGTWIAQGAHGSGSDLQLTFQIPENGFGFRLSTNIGFKEDVTAQLEKGSAATVYEPYKAIQTLPIVTPNGLPGIPVASGGNYTDENGQQWICDEMDYGRGKRVQRVGNIVLDGTQYLGAFDAARWNSNVAVYCSVLLGTIYAPSYGSYIAISNYLPKILQTELLYKMGVSTNLAVAGYLYISIPFETLGIAATTDGTVGVNALKQYLRNNPLTVLYVMNTPIETDLTPEEIAAYAALHTNFPNTTIYNDAGADMEVKYTAIGG